MLLFCKIGWFDNCFLTVFDKIVQNLWVRMLKIATTNANWQVEHLSISNPTDTKLDTQNNVKEQPLLPICTSAQHLYIC